MGQSFLTHDEKSPGSPSPDLLQFSGVGTSHPKFFGSLSSVKDTSTCGSSRSPLESADSERSLLVGSSSSSTASPRSPLSLPPTSEDGAAAIAEVDDATTPYSSLVPSPIQPGNVTRLREKFMDIGRRGSEQSDRNDDIFNLENSRKREVQSEVDCRFINRPLSSSATTTPVGNSMSQRLRGTTLPSSGRNRNNGLYSLNPSSYQYRHHHRHHHHHRNSAPGAFSRSSRTLPSSPATFSGGAEGAATYHKSDGLRSDNDLPKCFRETTLASSCTVDNFTSETPLVRQRPRTRPYVPPPRSVIIRSGYLPEVQTINLIPPRTTSDSPSSRETQNVEKVEDIEPPAPSISERSRSECFTSSTPTKDRIKTEDLRLVSSSAAVTKRPLEEHMEHVVTSKGDHTEPTVLKKDAEVNTSAEVLVLPKGTKTSVVLKSALTTDEVDGKKNLLRRRKKRGIRRVARVFTRIMIRFVELF